MKIVLSWLREYLDLPTTITPQALAAGLVQLGHEVDAIHQVGGDFPQVVIGRIMERAQHPNAERLGVCKVDVGEPELRQIVCGAPNARAGITVAVALPGALLPGGVKIGASKIRDVVSHGMICSVRELGLGEEHDGIWELETQVASGRLLSEILPPPEVVLEVAVTPNRGDCLSHYGVARDLAALGMGTLKPLPELTLTETPSVPAVVAEIQDAVCPHVNLIPLQNLTANVPSPSLIQQRLIAAGQRPKNALVDVTTYVMLALGQPLHAYDAAKLNGRTLIAKHATAGQAFDGLTGSSHTLTAEDVIVTDASGEALGLAGVLGGASTAISDTTTQVVLEAAVWDAVQIAFTGQRHQLHTDAKARFERGVDAGLAPYALRYAAQLLQQWAGGEVGVLANTGAEIKTPEPIRYHPAFFAKFIGVGVPDDRQREILTALGFGIKEIQVGWLLTPPTWRTYMNNPEDITEEILRVVGYETVPHALPPTAAAQLGVDGRIITLDRKARKALAQSGFLEILTYSFIGAEVAATYADGAKAQIHLSNPLAQTDMTTLRPSLVPGLLGALAKNFATNDATAQLAEVGKVFRPQTGPEGNSSGEQLMAAGVMCVTGARHWQGAERMPDVFTAKATALNVLAALGAPVASGTWDAKAPAHYHPGRSGTLSIGPFVLAHAGELHPSLHSQWGLPTVVGPIAMFELYLEPLLKLVNKTRPWQAQVFPSVKRDLSVVVSETMPAAQVLGAIQQATRALAPGLSVQAEVFDRYQGAGVATGHVALGLALTLQSPDKTLNDADVQAAMKPIMLGLEQLGATLRDA